MISLQLFAIPIESLNEALVYRFRLAPLLFADSVLAVVSYVLFSVFMELDYSTLVQYAGFGIAAFRIAFMLVLERFHTLRLPYLLVYTASLLVVVLVSALASWPLVILMVFFIVIILFVPVKMPNIYDSREVYKHSLQRAMRRKRRAISILYSKPISQEMKAVLRTIMLLETFNRPYLFRLFESVLCRFGLASTTGIMQASSVPFVSNSKSIDDAIQYFNDRNLNTEKHGIDEFLIAYNGEDYMQLGNYAHELLLEIEAEENLSAGS